MFDPITSTPHSARLNSLEVSMRVHAQDHKLALLVAGYRQANRNSSNQIGRSLKKLFAALITSLR